MKVLMVAPQPFFEPRGTPISIYQRLRGLSALGHSVDLVTYPVGEDVDIPNVTIHRTVSLPFIKEVPIGPSWAKIPLDILIFFKTLWMLLTRRYDAIHSHEEASFFAMLFSFIFGIPHVYDMHSSLPKQLENFGFLDFPPIVKLFEIFEEWVLNTCDVVLTIGTDLEEHVIAVNNDSNHIRIENIPIHEESTSKCDVVQTLKTKHALHGKTPIVYTGTFERYQGLDMLIEAAQTIVCAHPDVVFVMVGGKPEQVQQYRQQVIEFNLEEHFIFTGIVPMSDSLDYLQMADILVSPRTEGLSVPLKIYTYLHAGKPIVATNIYAHTQILGDETAMITRPTADAYANGVCELLINDVRRQELGANAYHLAQEQYSLKSYLAKLERAYLSIHLAKRISEINLAEQTDSSRGYAVAYDDPRRRSRSLISRRV